MSVVAARTCCLANVRGAIEPPNALPYAHIALSVDSCQLATCRTCRQEPNFCFGEWVWQSAKSESYYEFNFESCVSPDACAFRQIWNHKRGARKRCAAVAVARSQLQFICLATWRKFFERGEGGGGASLENRQWEMGRLARQKRDNG